MDLVRYLKINIRNNMSNKMNFSKILKKKHNMYVLYMFRTFFIFNIFFIFIKKKRGFKVKSYIVQLIHIFNK